MTIENINRHLLGFSYIGQPKAVAMRDYLTFHTPLRPVEIQLESIIKLLNEQPDFLQPSDALFVAIGKNTIEQYIVTALQNGRIQLPLFILWIEPYAIAGHMLYVPPGSTVSFSALFPDSYYQYNAVAAEEYKKDENRMLLKEAGCQSSYLPYSQEFVTLFLGHLFPEIRRLLNQPVAQTLAFTWLGNLAAAQQRGLTLSDFAASGTSFDLLTMELH